MRKSSKKSFFDRLNPRIRCRIYLFIPSGSLPPFSLGTEYAGFALSCRQAKAELEGMACYQFLSYLEKFDSEFEHTMAFPLNMRMVWPAPKDRTWRRSLQKIRAVTRRHVMQPRPVCITASIFYGPIPQALRQIQHIMIDIPLPLLVRSPLELFKKEKEVLEALETPLDRLLSLVFPLFSLFLGSVVLQFRLPDIQMLGSGSEVQVHDSTRNRLGRLMCGDLLEKIAAEITYRVHKSRPGLRPDYSYTYHMQQWWREPPPSPPAHTYEPHPQAHTRRIGLAWDFRPKSPGTEYGAHKNLKGRYWTYDKYCLQDVNRLNPSMADVYSENRQWPMAYRLHDADVGWETPPVWGADVPEGAYSPCGEVGLIDDRRWALERGEIVEGIFRSQRTPSFCAAVGFGAELKARGIDTLMDDKAVNWDKRM